MDQFPSGIDAIAGDSTSNLDLRSRFKNAADETGSELYALLSEVMGLMLSDDKDGERFAPSFVWADGSADFTAASLTDDSIEEMAKVQTTNAAVRARVSDILWERLTGADRVERAHEAIDAYLELSAQKPGFEGVRYLERALDLAVRFESTDSSARKNVILGRARASMRSRDASPGQFGAAVRLLRYVGADEDREAMPQLLMEAALEKQSDGHYRLARDILHERKRWLREGAERAATSVLIADLYIQDADARLDGEDRSAATAASFVESAVQELRSVPRQHRARLDIDARVAALRARIGVLHEEALEEMTALSSDPINLAASAADVTALLAGMNMPDALLRFSRIVDLADEEVDRQTASHALEGTIARLFEHVTLTADGRVSSKSGEGEAIGRQMALIARTRTEIVTIGAILPGLRLLRSEHSLSREDFVELARASSLVPPRHTYLFADGLYAGWNFDFGTAIHLLVPQMEAVVRFHLKAASVITTHMDQQGVEDEISLPALLGKTEVVDVFGPAVAYELRSLYTGRFGVGLRHDIAHGLVDDSIANSAYAVFAWWLALRMAMTPFWNAAR